MSKTMLNRLALLEVLDAAGPLTITELARRSGSDVTVVSRTVSACERDGWIARRKNRVMIGPRCALLGHTSMYADLITTATRLTHALAGVTGLTANAVGLVGTDAVVLAAAAGVAPLGTSGLAAKAPLHAVAAGIAIAAELDPDQLDGLLPPEPYADANTIIAGMLGTSAEVLFRERPAHSDGSGDGGGRPPLPRTRAELDARLLQARETGWVLDTGGLDPAVHCVAVPWPQRVLPAALSLIGPPDAVAARRDRAIVALRAAAAPGGTAQAVLATVPTPAR